MLAPRTSTTGNGCPAPWPLALLLLATLPVAAQIEVAERNFAGEPCVYFYRPVERGADGQMRVNQYADGVTVCHGSRMYRCEQQSWKSLGSCMAFDPGYVAGVRSELLEGYLQRALAPASAPAPALASAPAPAPAAAPESAPVPAVAGTIPPTAAAEPAPPPAAPAAPSAAVPAPVLLPVPLPAVVEPPPASVPVPATAASAPGPAPTVAVLWPSCLASFMPGLERLGDHQYRQFVAGSALRGQEPEVLARMALRAAAQGEYYKALYLSRIALDYDQFNAGLWENHAAFAEQVALTEESHQARRNAGTRQAKMQPLAPTLWPGAGGIARPGTLADWVALVSLIADDTVALGGTDSRLVVARRESAPATPAAGEGYHLADPSLDDLLPALRVLAAVEHGGDPASAWSYSTLSAPGTAPPPGEASAGDADVAAIPVAVLWASGASRAAFVRAQVLHSPDHLPLVTTTTLGEQAAGSPLSESPADLSGHALQVPRLAVLCTPGRGSCTPPLLPLEAMLSDEDFADMGLATTAAAGGPLRAALAPLSESYSNGGTVVMPAGNTDPVRWPDTVAGIAPSGSCLAVRLQPKVWLAPAP